MNFNNKKYNISDLMNLFSLTENFTSEQVNKEKNKLVSQLIETTKINDGKKHQIKTFMDDACSLLITHTLNKPVTLKTKYIQTAINIDSRFRLSGDSHDFQVVLPVVQKNVMKTTITNLDIPLSFYGVSRKRGDSTFIITENEERNSSTMKDNENNNFPINIESSELNYDSETKQWKNDFVKKILKLHPCFSYESSYYDIPSINFLVDNSDLDNIIYYNTNTSEISNFFKNPNFSFGWLIILPDGNYECEWQKSNNSADLVVAMNNALIQAIPGILLHKDGKFLTYLLDINMPIHTKHYGINTENDLSYNVNRISGNSVLSIPNHEKSVFIHGQHIVSKLNYNIIEESGKWFGGRLIFNVDAGGSKSSKNIQLRLGWQLGFRYSDYVIYNVTHFNSEGVAMITKPRYLYLSIDDGLKNKTKFDANLSQSILQKDKVGRILISNKNKNVISYKSFGNMTFSREYFGPGTISKLNIKLLDEHDRFVYLNNMDWSMTIIFTKIYE